MTDMGIKGQEQTLPQERILLDKLSKQAGVKITEVERRSNRPFDLGYKATAAQGYGISAWLPLAAISELLNWTKSEVANMTDYPDMVRAGDWSGVRDTESEKLWAIFDCFVRPTIR